MQVFISLLLGLMKMINIPFSARFRVEGDSMLPSLRHGESVLVVRTRFRWNRLRRGDVAVYERPTADGGTSIKRVVGLPGEDIKVAGGLVHVDGRLLAEEYALVGPDVGTGEEEREWYNGPDEYFLLGDNRAHSTDSRDYGPVAGDSIKGRAWIRCWPPARWRPLGTG